MIEIFFCRKIRNIFYPYPKFHKDWNDELQLPKNVSKSKKNARLFLNKLK